MGGTPYRPAGWQQQAPQKVIITFPGQGQNPQQFSAAAGITVTLPNSQTLYAFDAEIQIEHEQRLRKTEHPVQTGASVSDHAYLEPAHLVLDIGMSDAMDAYFNPTTWSGTTSKSVSAYQTMLALQFSRIPLQITTRLRAYQNMVIEALTPNETFKTAHGLRMRIEFGEIFVANAFTQVLSARPQTTESTPVGVVVPQATTAAQDSQYNVSDSDAPIVPSNAIGAGEWSSTNNKNLSTLSVGK